MRLKETHLACRTTCGATRLERVARVGVSVCIAIAAFATTVLIGQQRPPDLEWRTYGAELTSSHYSQASQIDGANFKDLEVAWRFKTDNLGPRPEFNLQSTPLEINGRVYSTGGTRRAVFALDAESGELLWMYSLNEGRRAQNSPRALSGRGLAYWSDGTNERILYVATGYTLVSLDAKTGRPT